MKPPKVVEQLETTIQAGGVDVLVEVVENDQGGRFAQVAITLEDEDDLDLWPKDVVALRDLADRTVTALTQQSAPEHSGEGAARESWEEALFEEAVLDEAEDAYKSSPVGGRKALEAALKAALEASRVR